MKDAGKRRSRFGLPQVQADLHHRGGFKLGDASLFPPAGTLEAIGGREAVALLIDGLYDSFETDKVLRPAFSRDLTKERERVKLFFESWFGGSPAYFDAEWPPGLIAAHGSVSISRGMAGRWIGHFLDALAEAANDPKVVTHIKPLISRLALGLVSRAVEPVPGERLRDSSYSADPRLLRCVQRDDAEGIATLAAARPHMMRSIGPRPVSVASPSCVSPRSAERSPSDKRVS